MRDQFGNCKLTLYNGTRLVIGTVTGINIDTDTDQDTDRAINRDMDIDIDMDICYLDINRDINIDRDRDLDIDMDIDLPLMILDGSSDVLSCENENISDEKVVCTRFTYQVISI